MTLFLNMPKGVAICLFDLMSIRLWESLEETH